MTKFKMCTYCDQKFMTTDTILHHIAKEHPWAILQGLVEYSQTLKDRVLDMLVIEVEDKDE